LSGRKKIGIVLFQLGGPDSLDAVEPFLRNLFLDPDIIPMGPLGFLRKPLANYIAKKRSVPVRGRYATDWAAFANRDIDGAPEACPGGPRFLLTSMLWP